ncbi:unnamed protein product [Ilex paraguariensis]|uniref:Polyprenol reductase n=1 Tax=Ilex paraguariensis TaxID=185542 RepID=A0ABC8RJ86_9AQUA
MANEVNGCNSKDWFFLSSTITILNNNRNGGLLRLLRIAWIAGTLSILIALIPSSLLSWFRDFLLGFAKRGKTLQSSSHSLVWSEFRHGLPVCCEVREWRQRFFCHFYVVAVVWTTFLVAASWLYAYRMAPLISKPLMYSTIACYLNGGSHSFPLHKSGSTTPEHKYKLWLLVFLLLLMEAQVVRRLIETIWVFDYSPSACIHIFGYITGLL